MEGFQYGHWEKVDDFIAGKLIGADPALTAALGANLVAGLPVIDVSAPLGKLLHLLIRSLGARRILEIGTLGGYSTIWLARALPPDGLVVSLEINPDHADIARSNLARAGVAKPVEIRVGPAREALEQMAANGSKPFDFIFIDADGENHPEYFRLSVPLSRPGTVIVVDNVVWQGHIMNPAITEPMIKAARHLYDVVAAIPQVSATAMQTVGSKGWDGFLLAVVGED